MRNGFVYILLNPSFPDQLKIGRTAREPVKRANELSRQTGVPSDYVVLYYEVVNDAIKVESLMHNKYSEYRISKRKEFFRIPIKDAIVSLQTISKAFPISEEEELSTDLTDHFIKYFGNYLDPCINRIRFIQLPNLCFLDITYMRHSDKKAIIKQEEIPLGGIKSPEKPTLETLRENESLLKSCNEYDWIMISDLFPSKIADKIAQEWQKPGGKLEIHK
jgi:hypothetical protein